MNIFSLLYRDDSTLYLIINDERKRNIIKASSQFKICQKFSKQTGVSFHHMVSGPDVRHGMSLKRDFQQMIPEQVGIVYADIEENTVTLLSARQRDMFFDEILALEEDADTLPMVRKFIDENVEREEL